jgi:peptidoglycan/xylan/chitin deacetylase (PgdA/CDA1 family)
LIQSLLSRLIWAIGLFLALEPIGLSAGPAVIAFSNRALWPDAITSPKAFDAASRAELLVFVGALAEVSLIVDPVVLKKRFQIKQVNPTSILRVQTHLFARVLENWEAATLSCTKEELFCIKISSAEGLVSAASELKSKLSAPYQRWHENAVAFHQIYAGELIRLAALFPNITSEIDTFSSLEHQGFELHDRQFLLTFDDGPTDKGGNTDKLLPILNQLNIHASFYLLGERLQARLRQADVKSLQNSFSGQCTSIHGWQHSAHTKLENWQGSVLETRDLVKATFPGMFRPWFRPPYGQRLANSGEFFLKNEMQVALWNIDSQDWNNQISESNAAQRVFTLMLLWRRGVILFHDIHAKAQFAVPWLVKRGKGTGVIWKDCQTYYSVQENVFCLRA